MSGENTIQKQDEENKIESIDTTHPAREGIRSIIMISPGSQPKQDDSFIAAGGQSISCTILRPMFRISAHHSHSSSSSSKFTIVSADSETGLPLSYPFQNEGQGHTEEKGQKKKRKDTESEMERLRKILAQSQPKQLKGQEHRQIKLEESSERQKDRSKTPMEKSSEHLLHSRGQDRPVRQEDKPNKQDENLDEQVRSLSEKISSEQTGTSQEYKGKTRIPEKESKDQIETVTVKEMKKEEDMPKTQDKGSKSEKGQFESDKMPTDQRVITEDHYEESKGYDKKSEGWVEDSNDDDISLQCNQDCSDTKNYEQSRYSSEKNIAVLSDTDNTRQDVPGGKADMFKPPFLRKGTSEHIDAFKTSFKGNTDSMDFIKTLWSPVMVSKQDEVQENGNQPKGTGCPAAKIFSDNIGKHISDRSGSTELSDSDTEEFSNDLTGGGKHNILMKGGNDNIHGTRISLSRSSSNTNEDQNTGDDVLPREITLGSPLELRRRKQSETEPDLKVDHEYEITSVDGDSLGGGDQVQNSEGGEMENSEGGEILNSEGGEILNSEGGDMQNSNGGRTQNFDSDPQNSGNIITVDDSLNDCGHLFTRLKPNSILSGSIEKNQLPISTTQAYLNSQGEQISQGEASSNIGQMHRRTDMEKGFPAVVADKFTPSKSLYHSQYAQRYNKLPSPRHTSDLNHSETLIQNQGGNTNREDDLTSLPPLKPRKESSDSEQNVELQDHSSSLNDPGHGYKDSISQSQSSYSPHVKRKLEEHQSHSTSNPQLQTCPIPKQADIDSSEDYSDSDHKTSGDLVSSLNTLAEQNGFIVKDVVPDGNCMFNAIVDQLRISGNFDFNPKTLRKAAVSYLRENPVNKDGTHMESFLHQESWETYLARMEQESIWGDHMALQACVEVTGYRIYVIKYPLVITKLEPASTEADQFTILYLGHVSESHFISLRQKDWEETWHVKAKIRKLRKDFPKLLNALNIEDKIERTRIHHLMAEIKLLKTTVKEFEFHTEEQKKHGDEKPANKDPGEDASDKAEVDELEVTSQSPEDAGQEEIELPTDEEWEELEDWLSFKKGGLDLVRDKQAVDSTSNLPLPHMKTIIVNMIRPTYLSNKSRDIFNINFQHYDFHEMATLPVGAVADELSYSFKDFKRNPVGTPVKIYPSFIGIHENVMVHEQRKSDMGTKDVIVDSTLCTPGYTHLRPVNTEYWEEQNQLLWLEDTEPFLIHLKMHGSYHHAAKMFSGLRCTEWPKCSLEWATRDRAISWPPSGIMDDILKTDCLVISKSHPKGLEHRIEWLYVFPNAEEILAKRCLTEDQRYCFSVFKVLVDFHTRGFNNNLRSTHLKTVLFYTCEDIPATCWSENVVGCVLYLFDKLLSYIKSKNLPNYFIIDNNMIDDFSEKSLERLTEKLEGVRMFPVASLVFLTEEHGIMLTFIADEVLENVKQYSKDRNIKNCVTLVLAPVVMELAKYFFRWGYNTRGCQAVHRAYGELLSYLEGVEKIPDFEQFVINSLKNEDDYMKYLIAYQLDHRLNTELLNHLGPCDSVRTVGDIIGEDAEVIDARMPVPRHIMGNAIKEMGFIDDLAGHYYHQGQFNESAQLVRAAIKKAKGCQEHVVDVSHIENRDTKEDIARQNYKMMQSFSLKTLTCFQHLYMCYKMMGQVHLFSNYISEYEDACDRSGVRYHYSTVAEIWRKLGRKDKYDEVQRKLKALTSDEDAMYDLD